MVNILSWVTFVSPRKRYTVMSKEMLLAYISVGKLSSVITFLRRNSDTEDLDYPEHLVSKWSNRTNLSEREETLKKIEIDIVKSILKNLIIQHFNI